MDDDLVQKFAATYRGVAQDRYETAASLPAELEATREFLRDMADHWRHLAEHTTVENAAINSNPMVGELETTTMKALSAIESRLTAIEKAL